MTVHGRLPGQPLAPAGPDSGATDPTAVNPASGGGASAPASLAHGGGSPTAAAMRATEALFGGTTAAFNQDWMEKRAAVIDRETGLPELLHAGPDHALLLRAMTAGLARYVAFHGGGHGELCFGGLRYSTSLDEFGCPILHPFLRKELAAVVAQAEARR